MAYEVQLFNNGNTAVFQNGEQVPALQESWLRLYVQFLREKGIDPEECKFSLPAFGYARWLNDSNNWQVEK